MGHPEGYTATDITARYKRMTGHNVLHPMGWDAFGLPAEQYALQTGTHPRDTTAKNVARFRQQLKALGFSYDWDREISTTDPEYYKWTQWIFLQLLDRGLAYKAEVRAADLLICLHSLLGLYNRQARTDSQHCLLQKLKPGARLARTRLRCAPQICSMLVFCTVCISNRGQVRALLRIRASCTPPDLCSCV